MSEALNIVVSPEEAGLRADAWVAKRYPALSKRLLRTWIESGNLVFNQRVCSKGDRMIAGATYTLLSEPVEVGLKPNPSIPLNIVYEDEDLIAINKPAGLDCQPNQVEEPDTLANALLVRYPQLEGIGDTRLTCGILPRIDCGTSGLVLVAKSQAVYEAMRQQFAERRVEKHYRALVQGSVTQPAKLEHLLAHNPRCPGRMVDASVWRDVKRPMRAVTAYRPLHPVKVGELNCSFLDVCIFTGVTHQIRAQLSFAGFPILGDARYGGQVSASPFPRHFLHAYTATFIHPRTQTQKTLKAPLTEDYQQVLGHSVN